MVRGGTWLVGMAIWSGCGGDATPTLSGDIAPLFQRNCTTSGCHGGPEAQTGLDLSDGVAWAQLVGVASSEAPSVDRVVPGNADDSYLIHKLEGTAEAVGGSGDIMPPGFGLAQSDIDLVRAWIEAGALDD
ncbi:MAG: hypothetical protein H6733_01490 [Alphaproteobacteria bacterium]|nr:hypothetical protein [Alphaproteobacteria bacterium]